MRRAVRRLACALALGLGLVALAHPIAAGASDIWGNVAPASPLGSGGLFGRYPLDHYALDQHFTAISVSLTSVDTSGLLPMLAYFFAGLLWVATSFLANTLITFFSFALSLDLVNGSSQTGGAGALGPVSQAIHSIYSNVFGGPWLVLAITVVGIWAMWKALVQRRYSETAGALGLSLIYVVLALFFVAQPAATIGSASAWTNQMSVAFLSIADHGSPSGGTQAKEGAADQLFELLVFKPWVVLEFGGLEHCVLSGTGSESEDPVSAPVRPLSQNPSRDAQLTRRLQSGTEVTADGKVCVNNANKYARHFLSFGLETDERNSEYEALNHGDSSEVPEADTERKGYRLGVADKPATDAMEEGGQYQRFLLALVVFLGELGAFCLLGSLSVGIILAQVLLLLLLAFAPVALVAAAIPGRGHTFFKGWLEKLAGYLLRKAAYSLILAVLLAVAGALASATSAMGWLMSFGLQALFFWAVFLQREKLTGSLVGLATGPGAPVRDPAVRLLALYGGARMFRRAAGGRGSSATSLHGRIAGGINSRLGRRRSAGASGPGAPAPRFGTTYSAPVGGGAPCVDSPGPTERPPAASSKGETPKKKKPGPSARPSSRRGAKKVGGRAVVVGGAASKRAAKHGRSHRGLAAEEPAQTKGGAGKPGEERAQRARAAQAGREKHPPPASAAEGPGEPSLGEELRRERERIEKRSARPKPDRRAPGRSASPAVPPRRRRRWRRGRGR
ncbi:MAG TPA: hypothetical protein VFN85_09175 [Solirubrobacterales bacterium]|nr:hypothetical protein [Solirubrobacterales bacterium]